MSVSLLRSFLKGLPSKMNLCRIAHESLEVPRYAAIVGPTVFPLSADFHFESAELFSSATSLPLDQVKLLAPVMPSKIVCVGRNYREHAAELGNKMPDEP